MAQAWREAAALNRGLVVQNQQLAAQVANLTGVVNMQRQRQNRVGNRMPSRLAPMPLRPV